MKKYLLFIYLTTICMSVNAQNISRAEQVINSLCSPQMHGRGYTNNGDKIAAAFIEDHFKKAGLQNFGTSYNQNFNLNVNTFSQNPSLFLDGQKLKVGHDYIIKSNSISGSGETTVYQLDTAIFSNPKALKKFLKKNLSNKAIIYDHTEEKRLFRNSQEIFKKLMTAKLLVSLTTKLTHAIATYQLPIPALVLLKEKFPENTQKIKFDIKADFKENYQTQNVIGYVQGTSKPDSIIVFSAHYDHLGDMGEAYFPGANDNASGTAALIELAYHYAQNPSPYSIVFMAFGAEEAGLVGSKYYTENPLFPLSKIKFLTNIDLFATGEKGLTAVNGSVFKNQFKLLQKVNQENNYLPSIHSRGKAANSDHYFFTQKGVPSFFFYLMGDWKHYHDVNDKTPVPLSKFKEAFLLIRDFTDNL